jgi:undecaprenyl-diphosphatase
MRDRQTLRLWTWAACCSVLCGVLLALVESRWPPLLWFDVAVDQHLHLIAVHHRLWTWMMRALSATLAPAVLRVTLGGVVLRLWWSGERVTAARTAACGLVQAGLELGIKEVVARPRPSLPQPVSHATGWSFPSGHAMTAATLIPLFAALAWPHVRRRWLRGLMAAGVGVSVVLVSGSRIALGVHWPSDVLAGWLLAGAILCAAAAVFVARPVPAPRRAGVFGNG